MATASIAGELEVASTPRCAVDLGGFSELVATILASEDPGTIWELACAYFQQVGFKHVVYGYSPDARENDVGEIANYLVLSTLPDNVVRDLLTLGHYRMSPTFQWARENVGIANWTWSCRDAGRPDDFVVPSEAQSFFQAHGLIAGCTIGFAHPQARGRGMMALAAPPDVPQDDINAVLEQCRNEIFIIADIAHRRLSSFPYCPPGQRLTTRQREVLEWVADGKTAADIALIMGITLPTVEKHLRLARLTLGVETTAHALAKAGSLNQIFANAEPGCYVSQRIDLGGR